MSYKFWNFNNSVNNFFNNSGNFNNLFNFFFNCDNFIMMYINVFNDFNWDMNYSFNLNNLRFFNDLLNNFFDCYNLRNFNNSINNFLNDFFNFNNLWNNSENFQNIIYINDIHDFSINHSNNSLINVWYNTSFSFKFFELFKDCFKKNSKMEFYSSWFFTAVCINVFYSVDVWYIFNNFYNSVKWINFN